MLDLQPGLHPPPKLFRLFELYQAYHFICTLQNAVPCAALKYSQCSYTQADVSFFSFYFQLLLVLGVLQASRNFRDKVSSISSEA